MGKITVKAARVNAGLTKEELANKMGVHRSTISSWETNPSTMQIKDAELLCKILNIPISNIFSDMIQQNVESLSTIIERSMEWIKTKILSLVQYPEVS